MSAEQIVRNIVYNDEEIVKAIERAPQSYNTLLQHCYTNKTMDQVLRRRIKRLLKENKIWKVRVPGTRFGLVLFCVPEHDYKILVKQKIIGVSIYYMYELEEDDKYVILNNYFELKDCWSKWEHKKETLKIPKYTLRDGGFRLWE